MCRLLSGQLVRSMVIVSLTLLAPCAGALAGSQISPMFTYQGVLKSSGAPYNGTADLRFTLFDAAVGGNAVGSPITVNAVQVTDGLFTADVYVDTPTINGDERWLAIEVRTPSNGGAGPYTLLSGRQHLTPVPHALFAANALHVSGQQDGVVWFNNESNAFNGSSLAIDNNTLRVDPVNHRVGVGTDTPMAALHIRNGSSGIAQPDPDSTLVLENNFTNYLSMLTAGYPSGILFGNAAAGNQQATAGIIFNGPSTPNGLDFRTGGNQSRMVIDNWGNIGMGTATPAAPLDVTRSLTSGPLMHLRNSQNAVSALRFSQPNHNWLIGQNLSGSSDDFFIRDESEGVNRLTINGFSGNIGIGGAINPIDPLTVKGAGRAIAAVDGFVTTQLYSSAANLKGYVGTSSFHPFIIRSGNQDRMILDTTGNVGIGTMSPTQRLSVNGSAGKTDGPSWSIFSDARLKTNIHDLPHGSLDRLLRLRGREFEYTADAVRNNFGMPGVQTGFIAQEVQEVFPQWIDQSPNGYLSLTERGTTALVVEALRDLRNEKDAEIAQLRQQVAQLESLVQKLLDKENAR